MEKKIFATAAIIGVILIIGLLSLSAITGNDEFAAKKKPNFNVSEVSHKVAVGKEETALVQEALATLQKTSSEVTVYNQNFALVKDVREINLEKGVNLVEFKDIAEQIESTSVTFQDLTFNDTFVVEQNYEYDIASTQKILEKYLDKQIRVQVTEGTESKEYTGELLSHTHTGLYYKPRMG